MQGARSVGAALRPVGVVPILVSMSEVAYGPSSRRIDSNLAAAYWRALMVSKGHYHKQALCAVASRLVNGVYRGKGQFHLNVQTDRVRNRISPHPGRPCSPPVSASEPSPSLSPVVVLPSIIIVLKILTNIGNLGADCVYLCRDSSVFSIPSQDIQIGCANQYKESSRPNPK